MNNKRTLCLLAALALILHLTACRADPDPTGGLSVSELAARVGDALPDGEDYRTAAAEYLEDYFTAPDYLSESVVLISSEGNNLNELGIFRTEAGRAKDMKRLLRDYLDRSYERNRTWYDSYIPQETYKLRDAEVRVIGDYAIYAILPPEERALLFRTLEAALREDAGDRGSSGDQPF